MSQESTTDRFENESEDRERPVVAEDDLFDLAYFGVGNREREPMWRSWIESIALEWEGGYVFSALEKDAANQARAFFETKGMDWAAVQERLADGEDSREYGRIVSFRFLGAEDEVSLPKAKRLIWALGGRSERSWRAQWDRIASLGVDTIATDILPDELPNDFTEKERALFIDRFSFVPVLDKEAIAEETEILDTGLARFYMQRGAENRRSFDSLIRILQQAPGKAETVCVLANEPQWTAALAGSASLSFSLGGVFVSPFRLGRYWRSVASVPHDLSVTGRGRARLRPLCSRLMEGPSDTMIEFSVGDFQDVALERLLGVEESDNPRGYYRRSGELRMAIERYLGLTEMGKEEARGRSFSNACWQGALLEALNEGKLEAVFEGLSPSALQEMVAGAIYWSAKLSEWEAFDAACGKLFAERESGFEKLEALSKLPVASIETSGLLRYVGYWIDTRNYCSLLSKGEELFPGASAIACRCLSNGGSEEGVLDPYRYIRSLAASGDVEQAVLYANRKYDEDSKVECLLTQVSLGALFDERTDIVEVEARDSNRERIDLAVELAERDIELGRDTWESVKHLARLWALCGEKDRLNALFASNRMRKKEGPMPFVYEWAVFDYWMGAQGRDVSDLEFSIAESFQGLELYLPIYAFARCLAGDREGARGYLLAFNQRIESYEDWDNRVLDAAYCVIGLAGLAVLCGLEMESRTMRDWNLERAPSFRTYNARLDEIDPADYEVSDAIKAEVSDAVGRLRSSLEKLR